MPIHRTAFPLALLLAVALAAPSRAAGPDVICGDLNNYGGLPACQMFGRLGPIGSGTVALGLAPTSCNIGDANAHWFKLPNTDHPVISQNFFRLSTVNGATRLEQIGQAWLKHAFGAVSFNECDLGCTPTPDLTELGVGCSDPYVAGQSAFQCELAPRSIINPYTGVYPGGAWLGAGGGCNSNTNQGNYPSKNHIGHVHSSISHRLQVRDADLTTSLNPGARYFGEVHYIVPHEYTANNGSQNNNVSHREFTVTGPNGNGVFLFDEAAPTVRMSPTLDEWTGAMQSVIEPTPLQDGLAFLAAEATPIGPNLWHYEYALYNMNLDQSVQSLEIPLPSDAAPTNIGFHAPDHHAPELNADNYVNTPWPATVDSNTITWECETVTENALANAIRFGLLYNYRFDAAAPPAEGTAVVGLFKEGPVTAMEIPTLVPTVACNCPGDIDGNNQINGRDINDYISIHLGAAPMVPCAQTAAPLNGPLDANDLTAFVNRLLTGTCE